MCRKGLPVVGLSHELHSLVAAGLSAAIAPILVCIRVRRPVVARTKPGRCRLHASNEFDRENVAQRR